MKLSDGEKLIVFMLGEIYEKLHIEGGIDPKFVQNVISNEDTWALAWKYPGLFGSAEDDTPPVVREVLDILEMWEQLEFAYHQLQPPDKARVEVEAVAYGRDVRFRGFDGNNDAEHLGAARVLVNDLDRFATFKGRDLNSHSPTLEKYRRMFAIYFTLSHSHSFETLNVEQIIQILNG